MINFFLLFVKLIHTERLRMLLLFIEGVMLLYANAIRIIFVLVTVGKKNILKNFLVSRSLCSHIFTVFVY